MQNQVLSVYQISIGAKVFDFHDLPMVRRNGRWELSADMVVRLREEVANEVLYEKKSLTMEEISFLAQLKHLDSEDIKELVDESAQLAKDQERRLKKIESFEIEHKKQRVKELQKEIRELREEIKRTGSVPKVDKERAMLMSHRNRGGGLSSEDIAGIIRKCSPRRILKLDLGFLRREKRNLQRKHGDLAFWIRNGRLLFGPKHLS